MLSINFLCIIASTIRDLYTRQGGDGQDGNGSGLRNFRVSRRIAKAKMLKGEYFSNRTAMSVILASQKVFIEKVFLEIV